MTVFSVKESDMKQFVQEAKRYGILYCAVRDPRGSRDGMVDIMVKEEDASDCRAVPVCIGYGGSTDQDGDPEIKGRESKES